MNSMKKGEKTRLHILLTAGNLFARNGYKETTLRDIALKAGVPLSLAYYYFPGKKEIYRECVTYVVNSKIFTPAFFQSLETRFTSESNNYEYEIFRVLRTIYFRFLTPDHPSWYSELISMVIMESGKHAEDVYNNVIMPLYNYFSNLVQKIYPHLKRQQVDFFIISFFGLVHHFVSAKSSICRVLNISGYSKEFLEESFDYVAHASLSMLRKQ